MKAYRVGGVAGLLVVALLLGACGSTEESRGDGKPVVVASTDVWANIVRAVGGGRVAVESIIDSSTADPHSYRATARDAADVLDADLVVYNGGGYDPFMTELLTQSSVSALSAFELSGHSHGDGGAHGHHHAGANEHVWYDPHAVARVADAVARELGSRLPRAQQEFADNAAALQRELDELAARIQRIAAGHQGTAVLATSPMSHYLLTSAGLHSVTPTAFVEAVEEGSDIPILAQQHARELISTGAVEVVLQNAQTVTPAVGKLVDLAHDHGVPVVELTETLPRGKDYVTWMNAQVQALAEALR